MEQVMANLVNITPVNPEPAVPDNRPPAGQSNASDRATNSNSNSNVRDDYASTDRIRGTENAQDQASSNASDNPPEDFRDVLEKRMNNSTDNSDKQAESKTNAEPSDNAKPQDNAKPKGESKEDSEAQAQQSGSALVEFITMLTGQNAAANKENAKAKSTSAQQNAQVKDPQTEKQAAAKSVAQKIVELPAKSASETAKTASETAATATATAAVATEKPDEVLKQTPATEIAKNAAQNIKPENSAKDEPAVETAKAAQPVADIEKGPKLVTAQSVIENRAAATEHTTKPAEQIAANMQKINEKQVIDQPIIPADQKVKVAPTETTEKLAAAAESKPESAEKIDLTEFAKAENDTTQLTDDQKPNAQTDGTEAANKPNPQSSLKSTPAQVDTAQVAATQQDIDTQAAAKLTVDPSITITNVTTTQSSTATTSTQAVSPASTVSRVAASPSDMTASPAEQIVESIRSSSISPDREISMVLNPGELGKVRIIFQQKAGEISGVLEVEKTETRSEIEKALPQIIATLQEGGVQIKRIDVATNNQDQQSQQQRNNTPEGFDEAAQQQFSRSQRGIGSNASGSAPGQSADYVDQQTAPAQSTDEVADGRINVYM